MRDGHKLYAVTILVEVPDNVAPPTEWQWDNIINTPDQPAHKHTPVLHATAYEVKERTV